MTALATWLDGLSDAARDAEGAEARYRADFARRVAELAEERAVAHRRVNLIRAVAEAASDQEDEPAAVAHGLAVLRARLGWSSESEARTEILDRFAPVCAAAFGASHDPHAEMLAGAGVIPGRSEAEGMGIQQLDGRSLDPPPGRSAAAGDDTAASPWERREGSPHPAAALAAFEAWYREARGTPFWLLFESVMPETPRVDW